jgi:hypothetical protein
LKKVLKKIFEVRLRAVVEIMNGKNNQFTQFLNDKLRLLLGTSFGIFLFILFFQPFPIDRFDFNNRLLFVAGFGAIIFLIIFLVLFIFSRILKKKFENGNEPSSVHYLSSLIILILCTVAFAFYLRYVGSVRMSFFIIFKAILICSFPPVVIKIFEANKKLIQENASLESEMKAIQIQIDKCQEETLSRDIEFISETGSENLNLILADIIFIQSADNYVDIAFMDGDIIKRKLLRNTLKNIELQLKKYSNFVRCHRTCIINIHYIDKLQHDFSSHWITIKGYPEKIPVSRQYLLKLREMLR